jgi:hypothetical protein
MRQSKNLLPHVTFDIFNLTHNKGQFLTPNIGFSKHIGIMIQVKDLAIDSLPELECDVGSPACAQAPESLGSVADGMGPDPLQPVLLQLAPVALNLKYKMNMLVIF